MARDFASLHPGYDLSRNYFGSCLGIMPFSFSMSLMFIFMPAGIRMSPGFWSALQAPSHFASIVDVVSRTPAAPRSDATSTLPCRRS
jgi:hypothetical protein